jgi:hypothetical protein
VGKAKLYISVALPFAVAGCDFQADEEGPPMVVARIQIDPDEDLPKIHDLSKGFAKRNGLTFDTSSGVVRGNKWLIINMRKENLNIMLGNSAEPTVAFITASGRKGLLDRHQVKVGEEYVATVRAKVMKT